MKKVLMTILLLIVAGLATGCATRIGPGHVGIQVSMAGSNRGVQDYTTTTGWVVYNPTATQVVEYPTYVQTYVFTRGNSEGDESFTFNTAEGMSVNADVNLSYQLDVQKIPAFYVKFRNDNITNFTFGYLHNMTRDCFTRTGGVYNVEQLMGNNAPFVDKVRECLQTSVADIGVQIQSFGIVGSLRPPQAIIDSINAKLAAQQNALKTEMEVAQTKAEAQKKIAETEGTAQSRLKMAQAEAESNKLLSGSLTPQLLQWRQLQIQADAVGKWNGQRPQVEGSGSGLLLNITPSGK